MTDNEEMDAIALEMEQEIATRLHSLQCRWNHTDGCGWFYREHDWTEFSHKQYLEEARRVIKNVGSATMVNTVLKGI